MFLAVPLPTLDHSWGDSITNLMLITAFSTILTQLNTRLTHETWFTQEIYLGQILDRYGLVSYDFHVSKSSGTETTWTLLFKFRQKQMHLFWLFVIFTSNCYLSWDTKLSIYNRNKVVSELYKIVYYDVATKIYFSCTKT